MVPVSEETETDPSTEPLNTEPINFVLDKDIGDWTDNTLPNIIYKYAIDTIQHDS